MAENTEKFLPITEALTEIRSENANNPSMTWIAVVRKFAPKPAKPLSTHATGALKLGCW